MASRFSGPGSLWKTSWKGRVPFRGMCCVEEFATDIAGQSYDAPGILPLVPLSGFFLGVVAAFDSLPAAPEVMVQNGDVANEGYLLQALELPAGQLSFRFDVFDGAASTANVIVGMGVIPVTPGFIETAYYRIIVGFSPPTGGFPNGEIYMRVERDIGGPATAALAAPYVNTTPRLRVGRSGASALLVPNCIHGLVAGTAPWADSTAFRTQANAWMAQVEAESQIVAVPDAAVPIPVVNTNGWRANNPAIGPGVAPNPWLPFVGAVNLVYANGAGRSLTVSCDQALFEQELEGFPYV